MHFFACERDSMRVLDFLRNAPPWPRDVLDTVPNCQPALDAEKRGRRG